MILNCGLIFCSNGAVFIEVIFLLSNLKCGVSTFTFPLLYHQPLSLHKFSTHRFQHTPLIQRCQLFNNCGNQDQQTFTTTHLYFPTTIKPSTESIFNDNYSVTAPTTLMSNILHHAVHGGHGSHLKTLFKTQGTELSNHRPHFKEITANKINTVTSHLLNTKQRIHEFRKFRPHDNTLKTNTDLEQETNNQLQQNIPKIKNTSYPSAQNRQELLLNEFRNGLDKFERKFYEVTFKKLTDMTAGGPRAENSISFVQSALFLQLLLLALSIDRNVHTKAIIDSCIGINKNITDTERIQLMKDLVLILPNCTHGLVFRWSSRLVLGPWWWNNVTENFKYGAAASLLHMDKFNGTETPEMLSAILNRMVEEDSKGTIHNTLDPDDLSGTVRAVFLSTLYLRSSWRAAPTLLNGTRIFRDSFEDPNRTIRMIRVNDMMRYANLTECDADALEVFYLKPGLSLLILVPHGSSLRRLSGYVAEVGLGHITSLMRPLRVAADLPLYTLRMSLLLPNKLEDLGLSDLLHVDNSTDNELKLSHGLQRLMFWAEAGRNAFKDDGLEWDETPQMRIVIDRPYLFFVRWNNITLMNGNFVL